MRSWLLAIEVCSAVSALTVRRKKCIPPAIPERRHVQSVEDEVVARRDGGAASGD